MQLMASDSVDLATRQAASIFFKNWVSRSWDQLSEDTGAKATVRAQLLPLLAHCPSQVRAQLDVAVYSVFSADFPEKWPGLLDEIEQYLQSNEAVVLACGLSALNQLVRVFRWRQSTKRAPLTKVIKTCFPRINSIVAELIKFDAGDANVGFMVKTIMKTFFASVQYDLPKVLQDQNMLFSWCSVLVQMIEKPLNGISADMDQDDLRQNIWWKAKKWAYQGLHRLFHRYGNPALNSPAEVPKAFTKLFADKFAPSLVKVVVAQTELLGQGAKMPDKIVTTMLAFLDDAIKYKNTWSVVKPHMDMLVAKVIYPLVCFTEEDQELFTDDPREFIQKKLDPLSDVSGPVAAAHSLLVDLVTDRFKTTFMPVLQFLNSLLSTQTTASQLDGALSMLSDMAGAIVSNKSNMKNQSGHVLTQFVIANLESPEPFLRMRALQVISVFCDADAEAEIVLPGHGLEANSGWLKLFEKTVHLMGAQEPIPVRVYAALLMERLLLRDDIRQSTAAHVGLIMQSLLAITHDIDMEVLTSILERLVEMYPVEVMPFAVELCTQLRDSFVRVMTEIRAKDQSADQTAEEDDDGYDFSGMDKLMTASGFIKTITTLILAVQHTKKEGETDAQKLAQQEVLRQTQLHLLSRIEEAILPGIVFVLENKCIDVYDDVFEMVDSMLYRQERISDNAWALFNLLYTNMKSDGFDCIEEVFGVLEDYILYGKDVLRQHPELQDKFVDLANQFLTMTDEESDHVYGFKLIEALLLIKSGDE
jgi:hypothetical protein